MLSEGLFGSAEWCYHVPELGLALLAGLDAICESFLTHYEQVAPVSRRRVALWEALNLLALVLNCWTKIKPVRLNNTMLMLERHLHASGMS